MKTYCFTLKTLTAFGTPLVGDTFFGQLCWAIAYRFGENRLNDLLQGYTDQKPFAVVSDAFPKGYLPLPTLPSNLWKPGAEKDRKKLKKKVWITFEQHSQVVNFWQESAKNDSEIAIQKKTEDQPHNTLNRQTMTTGENEFAPYAMTQYWYAPETLLDIYIVLDEERLELADLKQVLTDIGLTGFGRDASIGLGKFTLEGEPQAVEFATKNANACLTLANTAPQNLGFEKAPQNLDLVKENSFYQLHTRFGRHGGLTALGGNPFKKPIILAKTAAIFATNNWDKPFLGNGLGDVSYEQQNAVHQGYAPIVPVEIDFDADYSEK